MLSPVAVLAQGEPKEHAPSLLMAVALAAAVPLQPEDLALSHNLWVAGAGLFFIGLTAGIILGRQWAFAVLPHNATIAAGTLLLLSKP